MNRSSQGSQRLIARLLDFTFLKETNYDITFIILHSLSLNNCVKLYLVGGGGGGYSVELLKTATQDQGSLEFRS